MMRRGAGRGAHPVQRQAKRANSPVDKAGPTRVRNALQACACCDLLQTVPGLRPGDRALCARCGRVLARQPRTGLVWCLPLTVAAAILLLVANLTPLMALSAGGRTSSTTILGGVLEMWSEGERVTAAIVAFCAIIAPAGFVAGVLAVLLLTRRPPAPHWIGEVLRWMHYLQIWSLQEVMMLGILVALVKISELARVDAGVGIFSVGALTLLLPAIYATFDTRALWERIEWAGAARPGRLAAHDGGAGP
jgi:paraquat-inducible protein A